VLGCSQRFLREDVARRLAGCVELVERESGGGAVLTGPWLVGVSVVLPQGHPWLSGGLLDSYRRLGQLHVAVLSDFGVPCRAVAPHELPRVADPGTGRTVDWACFGGLSPWEVVNPQGRKLVGLAQRRRQSGVLLVAGTLVGAADWSLLCDAMGRPQDESILRQCTVSCGELAGHPIEPEQLARALTQRLEHALVEVPQP